MESDLKKGREREREKAKKDISKWIPIRMLDFGAKAIFVVKRLKK